MNNLPAKIEAEMTLAKALATSSLVPRDYRGQPANVLLAISMGHALGLEPAIALTGIKVIDGQPSLSAQLQSALVRRAGHKLRIVHKDGAATAILIRRDDPDHEHRVTWTMAKAQQAGLAGKGAWRQYPDQMLANRAITEVVRMAASDVLLGLAYSPEELGSEPEVVSPIGDIRQIDHETGEEPRIVGSLAKAARAPKPLPAVDYETGEVIDVEEADDDE